MSTVDCCQVVTSKSSIIEVLKNTETMTVQLENYKIEGLESIFYIPNFITEAEEKFLLDQVEKAPRPKWTQLSNRRLQNWGGIPHPKGMIAEEIPPWLKKYVDKVSDLNLFGGKKPNHVLINEYLSGQGIMPHLDGALFHPTITTINLGSHTILNFYNPLTKDEKSADSLMSSCEEPESESLTTDFKSRLKCSLLLQPRSLLILQNDCYTKYLHGIDEVSSDQISDTVINAKTVGVSIGDELVRGTRVSLTIRFVPKTTKPLIRLGK